MELEELREKVAEEVGYIETPRGYCSSGDRQYGVSDDGLIALCFELLTPQLTKE